MAKNKSTVYLGFEDEEISLKHTALLNSMVNKVGGKADWPNGDIKVPSCPICSSARPLIVQLYAPLEQSQFHRTLYIFACLNPSCSQVSKGWLCIRTQHLETPSQTQPQTDHLNIAPVSGYGKKKKSAKQITAASQKISWCSGADDWGDSAEPCEDMDTEADEYQQIEENGNVVSKNDNSPGRVFLGAAAGASLIGSEEDDDDEDESNSMENDLICGFWQLDMISSQNAAEDSNANCASGVSAGAGDGNLVAVGGTATASICAEIEGAETDVVLVDSPKKPERDLIALLKHTSSPAGLGLLSQITDVTLKSFFVAVDIELRQRKNDYDHCAGTLSADHIREIYQEYKKQDENALSPNGTNSGASGNAGAAEDQETYEKSFPAHGDMVFHQFVTTLQQNPGQIIRYSRDTLPLLFAPLTEPVPKCQYCNGDTICEVQVLSTLIPKLVFQQNSEPAPIEFGNILVFTCLKNCWDTPDKMRYERVIVQAEL